jgi:hypothetical protein
MFETKVTLRKNNLENYLNKLTSLTEAKKVKSEQNLKVSKTRRKINVSGRFLLYKKYAQCDA